MIFFSSIDLSSHIQHYFSCYSSISFNICKDIFLVTFFLLVFRIFLMIKIKQCPKTEGKLSNDYQMTTGC